MYDNFDKLYLQYNFGFVLFRIPDTALKIKTFKNNRVKGRKNNNYYEIAEGSWELEPGRYSVVPFCMQKGQTVFLHLDIFTNCKRKKDLEFIFKTHTLIMKSVGDLDDLDGTNRFLVDLPTT